MLLGLFVLLLVTTIKGQFFGLDLIGDARSLLFGAIDVVASSTCSDIDENDIAFVLFTRDNPREGLPLNSSVLRSGVLKKASTKIYLHGWQSPGNDSYAARFRNAYLRRGDYNVIIVNWGKYAGSNYAESMCNLRQIGHVVGNLVHDIYAVGKVDLDWVHLVGHSLGAHLAGYVGQHIYRKTGGRKVFRITGLDAAGPGFLGFPKDRRLDASDALFVDAIHTNGAQFGYPVNYGSVDFYPNCGLVQPGCFDFNVQLNNSALHLTFKKISCSHNRSLRFFIESINSRRFVGRSSGLCLLLYRCSAAGGFFEPEGPGYVMGEDVPLTASGSMCVDTNARPPFARG